MKQHIAILYADSRFTPWKENVDTVTVKKVYLSLYPKYEVDIIHMIKPCKGLVDLLSQYYCVVNLCYGFEHLMQWEVAAWLDEQQIPHLSAPGLVQKLVQNKRDVENLLSGFGLPMARSLSSRDEIETGFYIVKPVSGGCHRNISVLSNEDLFRKLELLESDEWMVQPYLEGREFSVAVLPDSAGLTYEALPPVEIVPTPKRNVYIAGQEYGPTERDFHPVINLALQTELQQVALAAHHYTGLEFMSRCDFRVQNDKVFLLDVNAMPNLHPVKSLFPQILRHQDLSLKILLQRMLARYSVLKTGIRTSDDRTYALLN